MKNCLYTKLKGSVDNDNLVKIGEFCFDFTADENNIVVIATNHTNSTYRLIGDGYFTNNDGTENYGNEFVTPDGASYVKLNGNGKIFIPGKYDLNLFVINRTKPGTIKIDIENFAYSDRIISYFVCDNTRFYGQLNKLAGKVSSRFECIASDKQDDLASFVEGFLNNTSIEGNHTLTIKSNSTNNVNLRLFEGRTDLTVLVQGCVGDFKYLGDTKSLALDCTDEQAVGITGSIEEFVQRKILNGMNTGTFALPFPLRYTNLYYNNSPLSESGLPNINTVTFSWDSQGNITFNS